jgi:hypothetical protein
VRDGFGNLQVETSVTPRTDKVPGHLDISRGWRRCSDLLNERECRRVIIAFDYVYQERMEISSQACCSFCCRCLPCLSMCRIRAARWLVSGIKEWSRLAENEYRRFRTTLPRYFATSPARFVVRIQAGSLLVRSSMQRLLHWFTGLPKEIHVSFEVLQLLVMYLKFARHGS